MTPAAKIILLGVFAFIGSGLLTVFFLSQSSPGTHQQSSSEKNLALQASPEDAVTAGGATTSTPSISSTATPAPLPTPLTNGAPFLHNYVEIIDSCGVHYEGVCANERSGPSTSSPVVMKLRTGIVLAVATDTVQDAAGNTWYKIIYDEWIRYPERVSGDEYVAASNAQFFQEPLVPSIAPGATTTTTKNILVDRSTQMLYAYDGTMLFLKSPVSTGLELTPTPRGTFTIYRKSPSRYMQGPLPGISDQYYDLPGVPWDLYFTAEGGAIHGAYWHNEFGQPWSHGCVNLPLDTAKKLYDWADVGTVVTVRD